jgi:AcrR family transcriptional regulator
MRPSQADAAIAPLAEAGVHGVTHRAVERRAGLPEGTASNYFRSREALLVAVAERVGELHYADMKAAGESHRPDSPVAFTTGHHASLGLDIPAGAVPTLVTLYGGALFTLVSSPPDEVTPAMARDLARSIVRGALGDG